jgi:hypothetical protein
LIVGLTYKSYTTHLSNLITKSKKIINNNFTENKIKKENLKDNSNLEEHNQIFFNSLIRKKEKIENIKNNNKPEVDKSKEDLQNVSKEKLEINENIKNNKIISLENNLTKENLQNDRVNKKKIYKMLNQKEINKMILQIIFFLKQIKQ